MHRNMIFVYQTYRDRALKDNDDGIIAFKGKPKYVVVLFEKYQVFYMIILTKFQI